MQKIRCAAAALIMTVLLCLTLPALGEAVKLPVDLSGGMPYSLDNCVAENVYEDESLRIEIWEDMVDKTRVHLARVTIADPSQLRTAPAYDFSRDQTAPTTTIAQRVNAVLAINGDYYSYQATRGGYMIRQGQMYINKPIKGRDVLVIAGNGDFYIEREINDETLAKYDALGGIVNSFNFGPGIIIDGELCDRFKSVYNMAEDKAARACICQVERGKLEYLCVVSEGTDDSKGGGLTLEEFTNYVATLGVQNAYNLDGGNSSALIYLGEKINAKTNPRHRPLSDIIYFASAVEAE